MQFFYLFYIDSKIICINIMINYILNLETLEPSSSIKIGNFLSLANFL